VTLADIRIALPLLILAIGALLTLINGALTKNNAAGTAIAVITAILAGLCSLQTPTVALAPTLGLSGSGLARLFTAFFSFMAAAILLLPSGSVSGQNISGEEYPATILFATFGMVALVSATNLLILFLGLEAMTFGFYILAAIDLRRKVSGEAGLKYLLMGALSAAFLAFGIALLFCVSGTLDIAMVMDRTLRVASPAPVVLAGWACLLIGIFFKLSLVPAHLWTPDIYEAAPAPVVAFLSGGSKAAAILLLLLLWMHTSNLSFLQFPLFWIALASMLVGNLAALRQERVRRMLAYSSIAQMGYVAVALISYEGNGFQAAGFYAIAYGIMSLAAFGAIAVLESNGCGPTVDDYSGRGYSHPIAAGVLAVSLFSLAGIPPTVGFTGKFLIFAAAIRSNQFTLAIIGILTAAVSIYYYLRIVTALYLQKVESESGGAVKVIESAVLIFSSVIIILLGIFPSQLLAFLKTQLL